MKEPTLDNVIAFVRAFTGVSTARSITAATRLEADLGITGDDGVLLLQEAERRFGRTLTTPEGGVRDAFGLGPDEFLFGPEGFDPLGLGALVRWVQGEPPPVIRDLTVGELHAALNASDE